MSHKLLVITVAAFFSMLVTPMGAQTSPKSTSLFSAKAIWNPPDTLPLDIRDRCYTNPPLEKSRRINCIASEMRTANASADAIKVMEFFNGDSYLIEFRELGQVDLAAVSYFLYNSPELSHLEILVNGTPTIVEPINEIRNIDIRKDPLYPSLARKFPDVELGTIYSFQTVQRLPKGGQRFIFNFTMLNGCRGCDIVGSADIGFDFDVAGRFKKAKLLGLKKAK